MATATEIIVKQDPAPTQQKGDWIVKVGAGQGGRIVSRHRQKTRALKRGRREGRKRKDQRGGAVLKEQVHTTGRIKTIASYGDVKERNRGILGRFL